MASSKNEMAKERRQQWKYLCDQINYFLDLRMETILMLMTAKIINIKNESIAFRKEDVTKMIGVPSKR